MKRKKFAFWLAVAGVSVLANFGIELAADKLPFVGLSRLVAYIHRGPSEGGN